MATAHIEAKKDEIAKTVLMPGDPLRAKFIADTYLDNVHQFNTVRNMFGFTGTFNGKKISVMGSGMGMASIGIYSYELYKFYDVDNIIRIGSCGAYTDELSLYDVLLADKAWSESTFPETQSNQKKKYTYPTKALNTKLETIANNLDIPVTKGCIHSSDVFYRQNHEDFKRIRDEYGCIAVEMEAFALFHNADVLHKNAACLLTVSDNLVNSNQTTSKERERAFTNMMDIALELAE
ncbi:MAG: purine-nucleoside phosphorylase [Candidatus Izimaplasma sp.]|nr:purine-nucleoside phosphorylase [Candidatus Izimaplasma bacterium]